jgi:hypothetical protein
MATRSGSKMRRKYIPSLLLPLFIFILLTGLFAENIQCVWTDVERIVAVGDLHGDFNNFVRILKYNMIIDNQNHWAAGKTHLVQIGDVMDRGNHAKKIFDLLMDLEIQAEKAGGKVHFLIGNHEELNIMNRSFDFDLYVTVEQFMDFIPDVYRQKREKKIRRKIADSDSENPSFDLSLHSELKNFWENALKNAKKKRNSEDQHQYYKGFIDKYGEWILGHNVVIKINNIIFVHGGISLRNSTKTLKYINDHYRLELKESMLQNLNKRPPRIMNHRLEFLYDANAPLWYREFSQQEGDEFEKIVVEILKNLEAEHMVTAHTPVALENPKDMSKFHGKIWIIDTSISEAYKKGALSALIIEDYGKDIKPWWMPRKKGKKSASVKYAKRIQDINHWIVYFGMPPFSSLNLNDKAIEKKDVFAVGETNEN